MVKKTKLVDIDDVYDRITEILGETHYDDELTSGFTTEKDCYYTISTDYDKETIDVEYVAGKEIFTFTYKLVRTSISRDKESL